MQIKISPVPLDFHEAQFVDDLAKWCTQNTGREVYLLRNQAVTGLGFFQAGNFYPDFLLWVQDEDVQHLVFVDPKGLLNLDPADPKIQFATRDIPKLQTIVSRQSKDLRLHAFILSNTPSLSLGWSKGGGQFMSEADLRQLGVLLQADRRADYIADMFQDIQVSTNVA